MSEQAYAQGLAEYDELIMVPTFRDFVVLCIAEGSKRCRNRVSIGNSDPRMVALATGWLRMLSSKAPSFELQYHADQDFSELRRFWVGALSIDGSLIRFKRKSTSGQLAGLGVALTVSSP
jgi:hypothetical protein